MAYFRSLSAVKWPGVIPDAAGEARGYVCYLRHLCEEQLPPALLLLFPILRERENHRNARGRGQVVLAGFESLS